MHVYLTARDPRSLRAQQQNVFDSKTKTRMTPDFFSRSHLLTNIYVTIISQYTGAPSLAARIENSICLLIDAFKSNLNFIKKALKIDTRNMQIGCKQLRWTWFWKTIDSARSLFQIDITHKLKYIDNLNKQSLTYFFLLFSQSVGCYSLRGCRFVTASLTFLFNTWFLSSFFSFFLLTNRRTISSLRLADTMNCRLMAPQMKTRFRRRYSHSIYSNCLKLNLTIWIIPKYERCFHTLKIGVTIRFTLLLLFAKSADERWTGLEMTNVLYA